MTLEEVGRLLEAEGPDDYLSMNFAVDCHRNSRAMINLRLWSGDAKEFFDGHSVQECLDRYRRYRGRLTVGAADVEVP